MPGGRHFLKVLAQFAVDSCACNGTSFGWRHWHKLVAHGSRRLLLGLDLHLSSLLHRPSVVDGAVDAVVDGAVDGVVDGAVDGVVDGVVDFAPPSPFLLPQGVIAAQLASAQGLASAGLEAVLERGDWSWNGYPTARATTFFPATVVLLAAILCLAGVWVFAQHLQCVLRRHGHGTFGVTLRRHSSSFLGRAVLRTEAVVARQWWYKTALARLGSFAVFVVV